MTRNFIVSEPAIQLLNPKKNLEFEFREPGSQRIQFAWSGDPLNGSYFFEYSEDPSFNKGVESKKLEDNQLTIDFEKLDRKLFWRVRTEFQASSARSIYWKGKPRLIPITLSPLSLKIQEDRTVFGGVSNVMPLQYGAGFVELELPQIEIARSYKIEIFRDKAGKSLLLSKTLKSPLYRWMVPAPGNYYWKVSYTDPDGAKSPDSELGSIRVDPQDKSSDSNSSGKVTY